MDTSRQLTRSAAFLVALVFAAIAPTRAEDGAKASPEKEKDLLALLRSDAPAAEKAITCKRLAIDGSDAAVPDLARLLTDAHLASWARIALEAIPGPAADEALRNAAYTLQGKLLVGVINSIGVRRDANAADQLISLLQSKDAEVASAAAVALGRIGNPAAANALRRSLPAAPGDVRSAVAEGCVLCAERLLAEGKSTAAAEIYDEVRKADVPKQRILEATRGAILARNKDGIPLLLEQFRSPDQALFQIALSTAREFPGNEVDAALAGEMARAAPDRAALLVQTMADRKETVVLPAVLNAAGQGPKQVRLAAIVSLRRVGDDSCLSSLLDVALEPDKDLAEAARATLGELPGANVDAQIAERLPTAEGRLYSLLVELVGQRRIDAVPTLVKALGHADKTVRIAALNALGETVALQDLPMLISQAVAPSHPEDAAAAQQALKAASIRMPDREACATALAAASERSSSVQTKSSLLQILGAMGGVKALQTLGAAAKGADPELQDVSSRLLGEWMTADAAPVLLDLAKTGDKHQVRALRGYIRIARQFVLSEQERAEMCQKAFEAADQTSERKLVLDVLKRYPNIESLKLAIKAREVPEVKEEATQVALAIAQKLRGDGVDVKDLLSKAGLDK